MFTKRQSWFLIIIILLLVVIPACGDDDDTPAPTGTTTSTSEATPTELPVEKDPVKIGAISVWSGAGAVSGTYYADPVIDLVEHQVKEMGGILDGRPVEFVKCDTAAMVSEASACATKLLLQDKVSALTLGGISGAEANAIADQAEKYKALFASITSIENLEEREFSVQAYVSLEKHWVGLQADFAIEVLKPKTAAFLYKDYAQGHIIVEGIQERLKAAGIEVISTQFVPLGAKDLSSYLTKIKYEKPDLLFFLHDSEQSMIAAKQIPEIGGLGDMTVLSMEPGVFARRLPGAEGWYVLVAWMPGVQNPGAQKFENDYLALHGKLPEPNHAIFYNSLWTAIEAIKLAGTADDTEAIGKAARSGNLEWESPLGLAHFTPEGDAGLKGIIVQIQKGGELVQVF